MLLQDCILDVDRVVTHPLKRTSPEEDWVSARDSGAIPSSLFGLYEAAAYLSFGAASGFLADPEHVLFGYFGTLLRGLKDALLEGVDLAKEFEQAQGNVYDPVKKLRGQQWDPQASLRARRTFRYLTVTLSSCLDNFSELIALFFTGRIPGLELGKAEFAKVEEWLTRPLQSTGAIVSPHDYHLQSLYRELRPTVCAAGPEQDWLPLLRLYRNKSAHMGDHMFMIMSFHDNKGVFHAFMPREWPYIFERHLSVGGAQQQPDQDHIRHHVEELLVHQDMLSYTHDLLKRVQGLLAIGCGCLQMAYREFRAFQPNSAALAQLDGNTRKYAFLHFESC
jgi:hypothetical protein